jgi:FkbM family methyltransferase
MSLKIKYGLDKNNIDITKISLNKCKHYYFKNLICIPKNNIKRSELFGKINNDNNNCIYIYNNNELIYVVNENTNCFINTTNNEVSFIIPEVVETYNKLKNIQSKLKIKYGSFNEEFPEQMMVTKYIRGHEKVLEIGGNIGRNSLIIAYILNSCNNNNFVSLECDTNICNQLIENRNINNLSFHIVNAALSNRKLIQKEWDTIVSDKLLDGYKPVRVINYERLLNKSNIIFDTLVLDCEGAFYYILMDMPEILKNINLIIMENDYNEISKKEYIDKIFIENNFCRDYVEPGGWGPCYNNFFEVWKKI